VTQLRLLRLLAQIVIFSKGRAVALATERDYEGRRLMRRWACDIASATRSSIISTDPSNTGLKSCERPGSPPPVPPMATSQRYVAGAARETRTAAAQNPLYGVIRNRPHQQEKLDGDVHQ
jgi:hypothetical protein